MSMKPEQEHVKAVLIDTVTLLCKNGLNFKNELKVQAVIGISVDSDVFVVHINDCVSASSGSASGSATASNNNSAADSSIARLQTNATAPSPQLKRPLEINKRTPMSAAKRMRGASHASPSVQHAKQQLRFPTPSKSAMSPNRSMQSPSGDKTHPLSPVPHDSPSHLSSPASRGLPLGRGSPASRGSRGAPRGFTGASRGIMSQRGFPATRGTPTQRGSPALRGTMVPRGAPVHGSSPTQSGFGTSQSVPTVNRGLGRGRGIRGSRRGVGSRPSLGPAENDSMNHEEDADHSFVDQSISPAGVSLGRGAPTSRGQAANHFTGKPGATRGLGPRSRGQGRGIAGRGGGVFSPTAMGEGGDGEPDATTASRGVPGTMRGSRGGRGSSVRGAAISQSSSASSLPSHVINIAPTSLDDSQLTFNDLFTNSSTDFNSHAMDYGGNDVNFNPAVSSNSGFLYGDNQLDTFNMQSTFQPVLQPAFQPQTAFQPQANFQPQASFQPLFTDSSFHQQEGSSGRPQDNPGDDDDDIIFIGDESDQGTGGSGGTEGVDISGLVNTGPFSELTQQSAAASVQQITRRVTITTNIQGQNVQFEQVQVATLPAAAGDAASLSSDPRQLQQQSEVASTDQANYYFNPPTAASGANAWGDNSRSAAGTGSTADAAGSAGDWNSNMTWHQPTNRQPTNTGSARGRPQQKPAARQ